jgi:hypothetical protein
MDPLRPRCHPDFPSSYQRYRCPYHEEEEDFEGQVDLRISYLRKQKAHNSAKANPEEKSDDSTKKEQSRRQEQRVGGEKELPSREVGVGEDVHRDEEEEVSVIMCFFKS